MGANTAIEWTDASVNFWQGCRKVSQGCANCYMFTDKKRYGQDPRTVARCGDATFYAALKWKEPKKIFTCSWSDFFIEEADEWRADAWDVIRRTPQHTWQILTKRPERIADHLPPDWGDGWANVWLGTSIENQKAADERIPHLLSVPSRARFLSCEPLLGAVGLEEYLYVPKEKDELFKVYPDMGRQLSRAISWVIAGGESGPNARPMHPDWARSLRDECAAAGVAFHFKQWGEIVPVAGAHQPRNLFWLNRDGRQLPTNDQTVLSNDGWCMMGTVGKKKAGRLLDGREWNEFPEVQP